MLRLVSRAALLACLCCPLLAHAQEAERLRVHGSNTLGSRLMPALVESWLGSIGYTGIQRIAVNGSLTEVHAVRDEQPLVVEIGRRGSAAGMQALIRGDSELAMMSRAPTAAERDAGWQLGEIGSPDQQFVVALNGARVLVAAQNPLRSIGVAQLREVLAGRIDNWRAL
ncbi:MAG TPA: flagellar motor protein MotB, partial [Xanthomonadaceae bacterium]|nr:flagellar motor protein MotB [Xanthomonadaceae bacterium]